MKEEMLQRLLSLIEKTGDRLVITDPAGEHPYVLMSLDHYEKLVVGEWKPEILKREPAPPQTLPLSTTFPDNKPPKREAPLSKPSANAPAAPPPPLVQPPEPKPRRALPQDEAPIISKAPSSPQIVSDEVEDEEKFYLEPLE